MATKTAQLMGFDLLAEEADQLVLFAQSQAEYLKANKGWIPCGHVYKRPANSKRGPATIACFGTVKPSYIKTLVREGKTYLSGICPRNNVHSAIRAELRTHGWIA